VDSVEVAAIAEQDLQATQRDVACYTIR